jgi:acetyltransferase-like isoleucine patch superfamily enzyme
MDIHPDCWIEPTASIDRTWPRGIHIAQGAYVGDYAILLTHDFTRGVYMDTHIGRDCIVGARAIIMPGVRLGDSSRVEVGAVVARDVPEGIVVAGNPAVPVEAP